MSVTRSKPDCLTSPVGALMRPVHTISPEDSLEQTAQKMNLSGANILPVVEFGFLRGVVTDTRLALALAEGMDLSDPVGSVMVEGQTIPPYATGAQALRRLAEGDGTPLIVVDDMDRPMGMVFGYDLYPRRRPQPRPAMVGGMATPFGVYLTNGVIGAGAPWYGLMATGATLFSLLFGGQMAANYLALWASKHGISDAVLNIGQPIVAGVLFLLGMRFLPLSGTHGAEHQVVHAIEREEALVPSIVRRMPRVHPRCGTNVFVAASIFTGIFGIPWISDDHTRVILAAAFTFFLWRPIGSFAQQWITTSRPTDKQLAGAIKAGESLLEKYAKSESVGASIPRRIWSSGMLLVMAGCLAMFALLALIQFLFHVDLNISLN